MREHSYFEGIDWSSLLRMKADFIPDLQNEDDTSYFDSRSDRYNHDVEDTDGEGPRSSAEDSVSDDQPLFRTFSSCSPRYREIHGKDPAAAAAMTHRVSSSEPAGQRHFTNNVYHYLFN